MNDYLEYNNEENQYTNNTERYNVAARIKEMEGKTVSIHTVDEEVNLVEAKQLMESAKTYAANMSDLTKLSGYDATKTQTLKNDNGTLKWVTDTI